MARTNTKTVTKHYDSDTVNGWNLNYEYESNNGAKPTEVRVNGTKGAGSVSIIKNASNSSIGFGGGASMDSELVAAVTLEIAAIEAEFES